MIILFAGAIVANLPNEHSDTIVYWEVYKASVLTQVIIASKCMEDAA